MTMNLDTKYDDLFQSVLEMRQLCLVHPADAQLALTFDKVMQQMNSCDPNWGVYLERRAKAATHGAAAVPGLGRSPSTGSNTSPSFSFSAPRQSPSMIPLNGDMSGAVTPLASETEAGNGLMWQKW
mmetsp:Transcript_21350/g.51422  ORF Transcript_21350/g.51422 Transcript_21350/m.51422 type:complete len:126 (-) Transcript_21350:389-766(-)